jgi:hypothetical protein
MSSAEKFDRWLKVGLVILALCITGLVGYRFGSNNMSKQWLEGSQIIVPAVIDYAIERYEAAPPSEMFAESNKELIKEYGLLLFLDAMGIYIEGEDFLEYLEHREDF